MVKGGRAAAAAGTVVGRLDQRTRPPDVTLRIGAAIDGSSNALRTETTLEVLYASRRLTTQGDHID